MAAAAPAVGLNAYIVEALRTPVGKKNGLLRNWHPADLCAVVVDAVVSRSGVPPAAVDDVIVGCVGQLGAQSANIGRNVVLSSKILPESVPGVTVHRQCGSGQQAIHFAAQAVMSGTQDIVVAAGVEVMSLVPIGSPAQLGVKSGLGSPFKSKGIAAKYGPDVAWTQFRGAELLAKKYDITRDELDRFAVLSHERAVFATENGHFSHEIVPVEGDKDGKPQLVKVDEGFRKSTTLEGVRKLKPLSEGGRHSAATASQISDGAAALLIVNENALKKYNLTPRARVVAMELAGSDPDVMLSGPIPATERLLRRANLSIDQIDLYEVNEAFGAVPLAWAKALKADVKKLNVNGGAQALGHPLGGTGCKLLSTLIHELERRKLRYGLQAICEGGGTANAILIESLSRSPKIQSKL